MLIKEQDLLGKKLLILTAHPDDEALLVAGTIYKNALKGGQSWVVCATAGERGRAHLKTKLKPGELKKLRKQELVLLSKCCCVANLITLDFPDTKLQKYKTELQKVFTKLIKECKPDFVFSFGPDGVTGHSDHIACFSVASSVVKKHSIPFVTFCSAPLLVRKYNSWLKSRRRFGDYLEREALKYNLRIKVNPKIKKQCFECHKSQKPLAAIPEQVLKQVLNFEYFNYSD